MDKERIIAAGEQAHALARDLLTMLQRSNIPPAHWDEVLNRVAQLIVEQVPDLADDKAQADE